MPALPSPVSRRTGALAALIAGYLLSAPVLAIPPPPVFSFQINTQPNNYVIQGVNHPASAHYFHPFRLLGAAFALDNQNPPAFGVSPGYHTGYINTGFMSPLFSGERLVQFYDCEIENNPDDFGCDNGFATLDRILMPVIEYANKSSACIRAVLGHELFHHVQFAYADAGGASGCSAFGATPCEGHARAMQDKIYLDLDLSPEAECTGPYLGQVNGYLSDTNQRLWSSKYDSALWWTYLMEQYGTVTAEPQRGTDFLARWYIEAVESVANPNAFLTTNAVIQQAKADDSVVNAFQDFTIANIVKDLDLATVSPAFRNRYSYRDEDPVPGYTNSQVYDEVFANALVVPNGGFREAGFGALQYGALYTRWNVNNCPTGAILRYEGVPGLAFLPGGSGILADNTTMFSLIAVSGSNPGRPSLLYKNRSEGWTIDIPQPLNRYQQIISVVSGRFGDVRGTHRITCDTVARRADLPFASPTNPVTPGPDDGPWSFDIALGVSPVTAAAGGVNVLLADGSVRFLIDDIELDVSAPVATGRRTYDPVFIAKRIDRTTPLTDGDYDLTVQVGSLETVIPNGIRLGPVRAQVLLAIDTSTSMQFPALAPRLAAVRRAARNLLYALPDGTRFGLIDFAGNNTEPDNDAVLRAQLLALDDAHRNRVRTALDALASGPNRFTSIGDALALALQEFSARAEPRQRRHVVLLSDGSENEGARWSEVENAVLAAGVAVHTIALGPLADQPLLARIADASGGSYRYVDVSSVPDEGALGDAFARAVERIEQRTRVGQNETMTIGGNSTETVRVRVPDGLDMHARHRFFAVVDRTSVGVGGIAQVRVLDPAGAELVNGVNGAVVRRVGDDVWVDGRLITGEWTIQITTSAGTPGAPPIPLQVFAGISAQAGLAAIAAASAQTPQARGVEDLSIGEGVVVQVGLLLPAVQKIRESAARVQHPDGTINSLQLNDSGERGDAVAGDGVWSGIYRRNTQGAPTAFPDDFSAVGARGSYSVEFETQLALSDANNRSAGTEVLSFNFTHKSFSTRSTASTPDTDGDLMPNSFETGQRCLNPALPDGSLDADGDTRASFLEYQAGTDPCDADTDGGGETDGSEHARAANAHDAADDALPPMGFAQLESPDSEHMESTPIPPNAIPIRYAAHRSYATIVLQRATAATGPFIEVASLDPSSTPGVHVDTGLVSGQRYWYRMQPRTANGRQGVFGPIFSGVAWSDPRATMGSMVIQSGRPRTDNLTILVQQSLYQKPWSTSNFRFRLGDLPASAWQPFLPNFNIALTPVTTPTVRHLAVRLRDIEGQESIDYHDTIMQHPAGSLGGARVRVFSAGTLGAASNGALVRIVGSEIEPVAISDSGGNALLDEMLPGSYTIEINVPGLPSVFRHVVVVAGQVVDLGDVSVAPPTDALFANGFE